MSGEKSPAEEAHWPTESPDFMLPEVGLVLPGFSYLRQA